MHAPNIYLNFPGAGAAALAFYAEVFGSEVTHFQTMGELEGAEIPPEAAGLMMHGRVAIGDGVLMASDHVEAFRGPFPGFGGFSVQIGCDTVEEAHALFARLAEGGEVEMAMGETFWAAAFGACRDRFGVPWMVNCDRPES